MKVLGMQKTKAKRRMITVVACAVATLTNPMVFGSSVIGVAASAGAQSLPPGVVRQNGFYMYPDIPLPQNAQRELVDGLRVNGGCAFKGSAHLMAGQPAVVVQEIGYNPTTCQEIVVRGIDPSRRPTSGSSPLSSFHNSANLESWYTDPLNIHITEDWSIIDWYYDYSCVTSGTGRVHTGYYGPSGWAFDGDSPGNYVQCSYDEEDDSAHFHNSYFPACTGNTVKIDYWYNRAYGHQDGSITAEWYAQVSGGNGCQYMLVEHHELSYGTGGY